MLPADEAPRPGTPGDLHTALRDGPFEAALDSAIRTSGLSLDRIQRRLADRGVAVSVTALSYWRRGRSRPERPQSRRAVRLLEELLELPADSLVSLLGPQRPRGRWVTRRPDSMEPTLLWQGYQSLSDLLDGMGDLNDGMHRTAVHERYEIDAAGAESRCTATLVLKAERDRVDRCVIITRGDEPERPLPELTGLRGARQGRTRADPAVPMVVAELLLDRVLSAGETEVVEYTFTYPATGRATNECGRGFRSAASLYTLEVAFDRARVPVRCYRCAGPAANRPRPVVAPVWVGGAGRAHMVVQDAQPGFHSLRWEWE